MIKGKEKRKGRRQRIRERIKRGRLEKEMHQMLKRLQMIILLIDDSQDEHLNLTREMGDCVAVSEVRHSETMPQPSDEIMQGVDCVLLDLELSESSGKETVREFSNRFPLFPFVVITGNTDPKVHRDCLHMGAHAVLVKSADHTAIDYLEAITEAREEAAKVSEKLRDFRRSRQALEESQHK